jgi:hypothetical protein
MTSYLALAIVRPESFKTPTTPTTPPSGLTVGSLLNAFAGMVRRNLGAKNFSQAAAALEHQ